MSLLRSEINKVLVKVMATTFDTSILQCSTFNKIKYYSIWYYSVLKYNLLFILLNTIYIYCKYIQKYDIIKQYLSKRCNNCKREMTVEILLFYPVKNVDLIEKWPKLTYFIHIYTYIL